MYDNPSLECGSIIGHKMERFCYTDNNDNISSHVERYFSSSLSSFTLNGC